MFSEGFVRDWDHLKPLILKKWGRITEKDLDNISPNLDDIVQLICTKYKISKESVIQDIKNLNHQIEPL